VQRACYVAETFFRLDGSCGTPVSAASFAKNESGAVAPQSVGYIDFDSLVPRTGLEPAPVLPD
jgi:hypothetical protein